VIMPTPHLQPPMNANERRYDQKNQTQ